MYHVCTRNDGPIYQGRGKNRKAIMFYGLNEAIDFAKEYSKAHQNVCEIFDGYTDVYNKEKDRKVAAYKKGNVIYYNK